MAGMNYITCLIFLSLSLCVKFSQQSVSTDPNDIAFYLYPNPNDLNDRDVLIYNDAASISNSRYDVNKNLIILIHGFAQNNSGVFPQVIKNAYLANGFGAGNNIITVDWGKLATPTPEALLPVSADILKSVLNTGLILLEYTSTINNVPIAVERVSLFVEMLLDNGFIPHVDNTHLIGMSLGGHVVGGIGARLQATHNIKVGRITGLDPAGPGFQGVNATSRLDPTDGVYVDVVHTNQGEFGYLGSLGNADFYVNNGGPVQPNCPVLMQTTAEALCSHGKAIYYYASSIQNSALKGCKCLLLGYFCGVNCVTFGEYSPSSARGDYYLSLKTTEA